LQTIWPGEHEGEMNMSTAEVIEQALKLKSADRYLLLEMLHSSLDKPDPEIDQVWHEEILRRIKALDEGRLETVSMEETFRNL
jgi:putative addiction module component (TIGR02574 family)